MNLQKYLDEEILQPVLAKLSYAQQCTFIEKNRREAFGLFRKNRKKHR
jgi:hypothetical protein